MNNILKIVCSTLATIGKIAGKEVWEGTKIGLLKKKNGGKNS